MVNSYGAGPGSLIDQDGHPIPKRANYSKSDGGIWVPNRVDNNGNLKSVLYDSLNDLLGTQINPIITKEQKLAEMGVPDEIEREGPLDPATGWETVLDENSSLILYMIQFGGNSDLLDLEIKLYNDTGGLVNFSHVSKDGAELTDYYRMDDMYESSNEVAADVSGPFKIEMHESNKYNYKVTFKNGFTIPAPFGMRIRVRNSDIDPKNVAIAGNYYLTSL